MSTLMGFLTDQNLIDSNNLTFEMILYIIGTFIGIFWSDDPFSFTCLSFCWYRYMKHVLDQYVENDYVIVYFHFGLTSKNKPKLSWLIQIYKELDRK